MSGTKISAAADAGTLVATDMLPLARSASTTAYHATMAEVGTFANSAYTPNYAIGSPLMDGTAAPGTTAFVSRGDHIHPTDTSRYAASNPSGYQTAAQVTTSLLPYAPLASPVLTGDPQAPTAAAGDSDTSVATTAFVQAAVAPALHDVGRNLLHNPLFNVAQRGTASFNAVTTGWTFTLDRWRIIIAAAGDTYSVARNPPTVADITAVGDEALVNYLTNTFTGGAGAANACILGQSIENVRRLSGKTVTISFWAAASAALKFGVSLDQSFGTGGSPAAGTTGTGQSVTLSGTLTRYSLTFTLPSASGKALGTNGDDQTLVFLWLSSGATNAARSGNVGVQSGTVNLWGVQLEIGSVATPLEKPDPRYDLANCQRFYQVGYAGIYGYGNALNAIGVLGQFPVTMRAAPTMAVVTPTYSNSSAAAITAVGAGSYQASATITAAGTTSITFNFTASADL